MASDDLETRTDVDLEDKIMHEARLLTEADLTTDQKLSALAEVIDRLTREAALDPAGQGGQR